MELGMWSNLPRHAKAIPFFLVLVPLPGSLEPLLIYITYSPESCKTTTSGIAMPIYSSDSDEQPETPIRLFDHQKSIHALLGGGKGNVHFSSHACWYCLIIYLRTWDKFGGATHRALFSFLFQETHQSLKLCFQEKKCALEYGTLEKIFVNEIFWVICSCWHIVMEEQVRISCNPNRVYDHLVSLRSFGVPFCYSSVLQHALPDACHFHLV